MCIIVDADILSCEYCKKLPFYTSIQTAYFSCEYDKILLKYTIVLTVVILSYENYKKLSIYYNIFAAGSERIC